MAQVEAPTCWRQLLRQALRRKELPCPVDHLRNWRMISRLRELLPSAARRLATIMRYAPDYLNEGKQHSCVNCSANFDVCFQPLTDGLGNWPWSSKEQGGTADPRYRFSLTSVNHPQRRCIGLARRRVGRGGRYVRTP